MKIGDRVKYEVTTYGFLLPKRSIVKGTITEITGGLNTYCWIHRDTSNKQDFKNITKVKLIKIKDKLK